MQHLKHYLKNNHPELLIFTFLFIISFWCLGNFPDILDQHVDFGIHPQVNKVFDHIIIPEDTGWIWQDMHLGMAGRSPIYGGLVELGLRLFGLTLFGVRIFQAIFCYLVLILLYAVMKKFYPRKFTLTFLVLFATSPWYLTLARSGGIAGFSLSLAILVICLVALLVNKENVGAIIPVLAGIAVAIIPYGYVVIRPFFLLLPLVAIFYFHKINKNNLLIFLMVILAIVSVQFFDFQKATQAFYSARGESTIGVLLGGGGLGSAELDNIKHNINLEFNFLFGLNELNNFWNPPLAHSFWIPDIVVYPRFLVPFFIFGLLICLIRFFMKPSMKRLVPIFLFGLGVLPGTVLSALGGPSISRDLLVFLPLYFFIAYCLYWIFLSLQRVIGSFCSFDPKRVITPLLLLLVMAIGVFQVHNFFSWGKIRGEREHPAITENVFLTGYFQQNPNSKILLEEFAHFGEYGAYAFIRCLGGKPIQDKIASQQIMLVRNENLEEMSKLIKDRAFDIVVSTCPDQVIRNLPVLSEFRMEQHDNLVIYYLK